MSMNEEALKYWNSELQKKYRHPFTQEEIQNIETMVSKKLPEDVVNFYKMFGGVISGVGYEDDPIAFFVIRVSMGTAIREYSESFSGFATFEGMKTLYKNLTGDSTHFDAGPRIPDLMLPLSSIDDNNVLLLDLSDKNYGKIWYWEAVEETWGAEDNNMLGFISNSFNDFINSLGTSEDIDKKVIERVPVATIE